MRLIRGQVIGRENYRMVLGAGGILQHVFDCAFNFLLQVAMLYLFIR